MGTHQAGRTALFRRTLWPHSDLGDGAAAMIAILQPPVTKDWAGQSGRICPLRPLLTLY
jgi:hypothetical protein